MSDDFRKIKTEDELKDKILSSVREAFTGEETSRWMVAMQDSTVSKADEPVATGSTDNKLHENMATVVDRLFDNFKRYAFEFNRALDHREFVVNCERPSSMRSQADYTDMGQPIRFCIGHISSRDWALVVQAEENRVRAYIAPIKYLVGFRPDQTDFEPYVELLLTRDRAGNARQMIWTIDGQPLAMESLPALSRRFFGQLVKVTRGEATNSEKFVFNPHELRVAQAEVAVERSYDPDNTMFFSEKKAEKPVLYERPNHTLAQLANVGQNPGPLMPQNGPQSGPNAQISAPKNGADLLGQNGPSDEHYRHESTNQPSQFALELNGSALPNNSILQQYSNPAAAPRPNSDTKTPAERADSIIDSIKMNQEVAPQPVPETKTAEEKSSEFAALNQQSTARVPEPASQDNMASPADERAMQSKTVNLKNLSAQDLNAITSPPAMTSPPATPVNSSQVSPESKPDKMAAAIASQSTTQNISNANANMNGEKSTYHFQAQAPESNGQKLEIDKEVAENNRKVAHAIKNLFDSVDASITSLTAVGVDAMKADDVAAVGSIMRQTKTLKVLRDSIVQLSKDWQKSLEN